MAVVQLSDVVVPELFTQYIVENITLPPPLFQWPAFAARRTLRIAQGNGGRAWILRR